MTDSAARLHFTGGRGVDRYGIMNVSIELIDWLWKARR